MSYTPETRFLEETGFLEFLEETGFLEFLEETGFGGVLHIPPKLLYIKV